MDGFTKKMPPEKTALAEVNVKIHLYILPQTSVCFSPVFAAKPQIHFIGINMYVMKHKKNQLCYEDI